MSRSRFPTAARCAASPRTRTASRATTRLRPCTSSSSCSRPRRSTRSQRAGAHRPRSPGLPRRGGAHGAAARGTARRPARVGLTCRSRSAASTRASRLPVRSTQATRGWTSTPGRAPCSRPEAAASRSRPASPSRSREGYAGFVQPRSGLALRHGVTCLNTPGLIDAGYRDEIRVLLVNTDPSIPFEVKRGDRIAQLVIQRVEPVEWHEVEIARRLRAWPRRLGLDRRTLNARCRVHCDAVAHDRKIPLRTHRAQHALRRRLHRARRAAPRRRGSRRCSFPITSSTTSSRRRSRLAHAAAVTDTLRIGPLVLGNDYKHPVVLAREVGTLDLLSNGRLELGIGAGWMTADYEKAGMPLDSPGVRIARLAESIAIIKGLLGDGPFTFDGEYYRVTDLDGQPKPVQRPHPPFIVGGGGPKILALAAREAEIVGINANLRSGDGNTPMPRTRSPRPRPTQKLAVVAGGRGPPFRRSRDPDARRVRARRRRTRRGSSTRWRSRSVSIGTTRTWRR